MQAWAYAVFGRGANLLTALMLAASSEGEWLSPLQSPQRDWATTAEIRTKNSRRLSTAGQASSARRKAINCVYVDATAPLAARGRKGSETPPGES